jgi:hypothetical protein
MRNRIATDPQSRMNRAIARRSSSIVVTLEPACHAGGRGFESRRPRMKRGRKPRPGAQPFWNVRGTQRRQPVVIAGKARTAKAAQRATNGDRRGRAANHGAELSHQGDRPCAKPEVDRFRSRRSLSSTRPDAPSRLMRSPREPSTHPCSARVLLLSRTPRARSGRRRRAIGSGAELTRSSSDRGRCRPGAGSRVALRGGSGAAARVGGHAEAARPLQTA